MFLKFLLIIGISLLQINAIICLFCPSSIDLRFDCLPDYNETEIFSSTTTEEACKARNCCWSPILDNHQIPACFYQEIQLSYEVESNKEVEDGLIIGLKQIQNQVWPPNQAKQLTLTATFLSNSILRIKIINSDKVEFEPDLVLDIDKTLTHDKRNLNYIINFNPDSLELEVLRHSSSTPVFKTSINTFLYSDQFKQISLSLPNDHIFGLGEHVDELNRGGHKWRKYTFFNKGSNMHDVDWNPEANLYGTHPFFIGKEDKAVYYGVYLNNVNAMDVVIQPTPAITYRTIGGILDFFVFLGPNPSDVVSQYSQVIGKPFLPPYWSLGFHLCRYDYRDTDTMRRTWKRTMDAGIPFDAQWQDIDYMKNSRDFTYDDVKYKDLPMLIKEIHDHDMKYIINISPGLEANSSYETYAIANERNLFIMDPKTNKPLVGTVWQNNTVWLDFSNPNTTEFWTEELDKFHNDIQFDALWIDMNEPYSFRSGEGMGCDFSDVLETPPYLPGGILPNTETICMNSEQHAGLHYDVHSLYAAYESRATSQALENILKNERPFVMSRANVAGQGKWSAHWNGDVVSDWRTMRHSIVSMLNFNMFGMPMIGSDICGFIGNTTEELCLRWHQLGAFYPFSRNHNDFDTIEQDPVAMGPRVTRAAVASLSQRYYFLPYLYTLFYKSHLLGETVARPLFFEFPDDVNTYDIQEQFMWGPAIMFYPALYPNQTQVHVYFPKSKWLTEQILTGPSNISMPVNDLLPGFAYRYGNIIPVQEAKMNTVESRRGNLDLIVLQGEDGRANGELYWDDGSTLNSRYNHVRFISEGFEEGQIEFRVERFDNVNSDLILGKIDVYGVDRLPSRLTVDGQSTRNYQIADFFNNPHLQINCEDLKQSVFSNILIKWE